MKKIRFGILSTAKIARTKVVSAIQNAKHCDVTAIGSRSLASAERAAEELGIPYAYGSYEALLKSPEVDAVYIPLPNHLHVQWTINAMKAGKHVLCEKPIGLNTEEINSLIDATSRYPNLKIMEGFMYRFHPQWVDAKRMVDMGEIGDLTTIQSFFSYYNDDPKNIRNHADKGGGGLMDIGCYPVSLSRFLFGAEPKRVCGFADIDPRFGTDRLFSGMLDFSGRIATFTCSTQLSPYQRVNILGTKGRIEILIPFNPPQNGPTQIIRQCDGDEEASRTITFGVSDQYAIQCDLFAQSITNDTPVPTPLTDAWANLHTMEVLKESAKQNQWRIC